MSYAQPRDPGRKLTGIVAVLLLHALLVYALVNGLARKIVQVVSEPMQTEIIGEMKPPQAIPQVLSLPKFAPPPPLYVPPPEVQVQLPVEVRIQLPTSTQPDVSAEATAPRQVTRSAAIVNAGSCEKPEYPPSALRAHEDGLVTLGFLIDVDGKVLESKILKSTASRRLDDAARKALGLCKFRPGLVDGKPEKSWAKIEYEWRIE